VHSIGPLASFREAAFRSSKLISQVIIQLMGSLLSFGLMGTFSAQLWQWFSSHGRKDRPIVKIVGASVCVQPAAFPISQFVTKHNSHHDNNS